MSGRPVPLGEECTRALRSYLAHPDEETLHGAYRLGRRALTEGLGLLDVLALVEEALGEIERRAPARGGGATPGDRSVPSARTFVQECLSPYEMALRGAREANSALHRQNEILEEEVRRIAHALHDSVGQNLASAHHEIDLAAGATPPGAVPHLAEIRRHLDQLEADLRRLSHELRPSILDDLGLVPAIEFLCAGISRRAGIAVTVSSEGVSRLPPPVETALYRAVQEALRNAERHARATRVSVHVERVADEVRCVVEDDGAGFGTRPAPGPLGTGGLGLVGIRERLASLGGSLLCEPAAPAAGSASSAPGGRAASSVPGAVTGPPAGPGARLVLTIPLSSLHAAPAAAR